MSKKSTPSAEPDSRTVVVPTQNRNFRARIVYKSGSSQDFLIVATSTTSFEVMRKAYIGYLNSGTPKSGFYTLFTSTVVVDWTQVASFHEWVD